MTTTETTPIISARLDLPAIQQTPGIPPRAPSNRSDKARLLDRKGIKPAVGFLVPIVLLISWWAVTAAGVFTPVQLPSPSAVFYATVWLVLLGVLWLHFGFSFQRSLLGC